MQTTDFEFSNIDSDVFDLYFECITSCHSINGEDVECITACIATHLDKDRSS